MSDPDVLYLQSYLGLKTDGSFGPVTEKSVKDWQSRSGLTPTGVVGADEWTRIIGDTRRPVTDRDWESAASVLGVRPEALKAIKEVETGRMGAFGTDQRPAALFEAHLFWRNLGAIGKDPAALSSRHPGILSKTWNRGLYKGGPAEYGRLREAWQISPVAAVKSASFGFPQIIGQNFPDPLRYLAESYRSETDQLGYFVQFLKTSGIVVPLKALDWVGVAKRYNGPGYAANRYDRKLAEAYQRLIKE